MQPDLNDDYDLKEYIRRLVEIIKYLHFASNATVHGEFLIVHSKHENHVLLLKAVRRVPVIYCGSCFIRGMQQRKNTAGAGDVPLVTPGTNRTDCAWRSSNTDLAAT
jgi:hypothetical protein